MFGPIVPSLRAAWDAVLERLYFLPPFPEHIDTLALFSLLLITGLLLGEWLHARLRWPKVIGYVLSGTLFGPHLLGWISLEALAQAKPIADAALGLLMLEVGRRLNLHWLLRNRTLLNGAIAEISLCFGFIFTYAWFVVGLSPAWAAACAAVTMASAPAVVLLTLEETRAQGMVSDRILLYTALGSAASFIAFALVLGIVHAEHSQDWLNALVHPLWVAIGAAALASANARLAIAIAQRLPKRSLAQVFVLIATALLTTGLARMLAIPVFLTLFFMGVLLAARDHQQTLSYTQLPEGHWLLAIILFVIVGASLPWSSFTWLTGLQAVGLLLVRATAKFAAIAATSRGISAEKRWLIGLGIQPLSATAVFMAYELTALYPEIGRSALALPLFSAAIMELIGPVLCRLALTRAGECAPAAHPQGDQT